MPADVSTHHHQTSSELQQHNMMNIAGKQQHCTPTQEQGLSRLTEYTKSTSPVQIQSYLVLYLHPQQANDYTTGWKHLNLMPIDALAEQNQSQYQ